MLFDLENDPAEQNDLSAKHPDIVRRLKAAFDKTLAQVPEFKRPKRFNGLRRLTGGRLEDAWEAE